MAIFFLVVGIVILLVSLYMIFRTIQLNKKGVKIITTVTECEEVEKVLKDKVVKLGYDTTFKFEYDGEMYTEIMRTEKKYEIGSTHSGTYIHNGKQGNLYLDEEGVYNGSIQNGLLVLYLSGIPFLLAVIMGTKLNQEISSLFLFLYIVAFVVGVRLSPKGFSRFKYDDPESAKGVNLKEFFKINDKIDETNEQDKNS